MKASTTHRLPIERTTLDSVFRAAKRAGPREVMGLLANDPRRGTAINFAAIIPAQASFSHAEAEPIHFRQAIDRLHAQQLRIRGLWHSHGNLRPYHSVTDDELVARLMPALAEQTWERPPHASAAPTITGPDTAQIPLPDGRTLQVELHGPAVPDLPGTCERAQWTNPTWRFDAQLQKPELLQVGDHLALRASGVELLVGIAGGCSVQTAVVDRAAYRFARLYSLVVNRRRETYAEVITVHERSGETQLVQEICALDAAAIAAPPAKSILSQAAGAILRPLCLCVSKNGSSPR